MRPIDRRRRNENKAHESPDKTLSEANRKRCPRVAHVAGKRGGRARALLAPIVNWQVDSHARILLPFVSLGVVDSSQRAQRVNIDQSASHSGVQTKPCLQFALCFFFFSFVKKDSNNNSRQGTQTATVNLLRIANSE